MDKLTISQYKASFDGIAHYIENEKKEQVEIWFARELQSMLGYARWENFVVALNRAAESCKTYISMLTTIFVKSRKWSISAVAQNERWSVVPPLTTKRSFNL